MARNDSSTRAASPESDRWERLLEAFFQAEVPEAVRSLPASSTGRIDRRTTGVSGSRRPAASRYRERAACLCVAGIAMLLMVSAFWSGPRPAGTVPDGNAARSIAATENARAGSDNENALPASLPPVVAPGRDSVIIERLATGVGPVEWRTDIRWKNVSFVEPETGEQLEMLLPELSIEVFDIDEAEPNNPAEPQR